MSSDSVHLIDHPLIRNHLSKLRDTETPPSEFRTHLRAIGRLMVYEITRDFPLSAYEVRTPLETTTGYALAKPVVTERKVGGVSIHYDGELDGLLAALAA